MIENFICSGPAIRAGGSINKAFGPAVDLDDQALMPGHVNGLARDCVPDLQQLVQCKNAAGP